MGMYAKWGSLENAQDVFDKIPKSSVFYQYYLICSVISLI